MDKLNEAKAQKAQCQAEAEVILYDAEGKARDLSDDDRAAVDGFVTRITDLEAKIEQMEADEARFVAITEAKARAKATVKPQPSVQPLLQTGVQDRKIPATAHRYGSLVAFKGEHAELEAYRFGIWCAACMGHPWAQERARDQGLPLRRALGEGTNTAGGFLVPDEFESTLITLREQYGAFRKHARIVPMSSDVKRYPRRTGNLTAYFPGEGTAGTESDSTYDQLSLTAKKLMCLTKYSAELNEDAIINVGDDLAGEIAYAFAYKEDMCGFMANGQQTYAGMVGVGPRLTNVNGVDEGGGVIVGTGDTPAELALADFNKTVAILPGYADGTNAAWYCNRNVWAHMQRLESAAGGTPGSEIVEGYRVMRFLGYPVHFVQVMDKGTAISQVLAILGDLRMAADMGTRRGTTLAISDSALNAFEKDELVIRGTERFDINVHDVGTATVAGPVVGLVGKAS